MKQKKICIFDFDGTLVDSPLPYEGKKIWEKHMGKKFPYKGWWSKKESLDVNVFNIKPFPKILSELNKCVSDEDSYVVILTARIEKLRPEIEIILSLLNIVVDEVILKRGNRDKGIEILDIAKNNPELEVINVYDDMQGKTEKLLEYINIANKLPKDVEYNIYHAYDGDFSLIENDNKMIKIITEEVRKCFT